MRSIVWSKSGMTLLTLGAALLSLGQLFEVVAIVTVSPSDASTTNDLFRAGNWIQFSGSVVLLAAVCAVGWAIILRQEWQSLYEVGP